MGYKNSLHQVDPADDEYISVLKMSLSCVYGYWGDTSMPE